MSRAHVAATPADAVIAAFGGVCATARALGLSPSSVSRWRMPAARGGIDGRVPSRHQSAILALSRRLRLGLTARDLIA